MFFSFDCVGPIKVQVRAPLSDSLAAWQPGAWQLGSTVHMTSSQQNNEIISLKPSNETISDKRDRDKLL